MFWRKTYKLVKIGMSITLLTFVGIMGFFYISEDYDAYIVLSDSMSPAINSGDLVLVGSPDHLFVSKIEPGNIVTYRHNEGMVTHRIISVTGDTLVTKGDAMEDTDQGSVSRFSDVEGCYIARIPYVGHLNTFIKTKTGWFITIILPAILLLTLIIKEIIKEAFRTEKTYLKGGHLRY